jgi:hypothetical protein
MPLVMAALATELTSVFMGKPSSGADAASQVAGAYDNYCKAALAPPGLPIFTGAEKNTFQVILSLAWISVDTGDANITAQAIGDAIQAYWMSPPVMFVGGPATGLVTAVPGALSVVPAIAGALANTQNTDAVIGQQLATQMDIATKTVLVTYSTPPPPAGPPPPALVM